MPLTERQHEIRRMIAAANIHNARGALEQIFLDQCLLANIPADALVHQDFVDLAVSVSGAFYTIIKNHRGQQCLDCRFSLG